MRLLHTADWHLGRLLRGERLLEEQAYLLEQLIALARSERPDAVIIAGDLYDRSIPPPEAVKLLDHTLAELVLGLKLPVIAIAGNHDSPERLGFGARLLSVQQLHVTGTVQGITKPVMLTDEHGPVAFFSLPYAEPPVVRSYTGLALVQDHDSAMRALIAKACAARRDDVRNVLIGHAFVAGGEECTDSERPLAVGGAEYVAPESFAAFSYAALGHLHRPQAMLEGKVHYSGSLMKYSFAETNHGKSVTMVTLDANGLSRAERIPLTPRRDLRCREGYFADLMRNPRAEDTRDYLEITLLDQGPVLDAASRLRDVYPHLLSLRRKTTEAEDKLHRVRGDARERTALDLFSEFFKEVTTEPLSGPQSQELQAVLDHMNREERESEVRREAIA